jgi:DnaJ homolog subfamily C member 28
MKTGFRLGTISMDEEHKEKPTLRDWENMIEEQIRQAIERGDFDNLRGKGKPLNLGDDSFVPEDMRLAYKLMKDAGVAPEWIEQNKEIRAELQQLKTLLDNQSRWQRDNLVRANRLSPYEMIKERERIIEKRERTIRIFRERATTLNKAIDTFNLKAPSMELHHTRVRIEEQVKKFLDECENK